MQFFNHKIPTWSPEKVGSGLGGDRRHKEMRRLGNPFVNLAKHLEVMDKIMVFEDFQVRVTSDEEVQHLEEDSILTVWTKNYGLAVLVTQLFLAEAKRKDLWYRENGSTGGSQFWEITLTGNKNGNWKGWSRSGVMEIVKAEKTKQQLKGKGKFEELEAIELRHMLAGTGAPKIRNYSTDLNRRRKKAYTAADIIGILGKDFKRGPFKIENVADNLSGSFQTMPQYVFGITQPGIDGGIDQYVVNQTGRLSTACGIPAFYPFVFEGNQQRQLKKVLTELGNHYRAKLDVSAMARQVGMNERITSQRFFLVVTVLPITMLVGV